MSVAKKKYERNLSIRSNILSTIAYFNFFTYPLKKREIWLFLPNVYEYIEFEIALQLLVNNASIYKIEEFFSLENNYTIVQRRVRGNIKAKELIKVAEKIALFLSKFPFVRGIAVSGLLSKKFADDTSGIDLFIVAAKNRLWIARTFIHFYKKFTFLIKKQPLFYTNYFIEEEHLEIAEKNIYTATEISTLLPLQGSVAFEKFYSYNKWINTFLPNKYLRISSAKKIKKPWTKWMTEAMLNNVIGNALDDLFMRITAKRWMARSGKTKMKSCGIITDISATKYYAKAAPFTFENKLIDQYERKVIELMNKKEMILKPIL